MYGSTWIPSGCGSAILLWGDAGDAMVEFLHRKQPMNQVGPFKIEHDARSGTSAVHADDRQDLVALARRCATSGISAKEAAAALHDERQPTDRQIAAARRKLQDLKKKKMLVTRDSSMSGGRGNATLWFPAAPPDDIRCKLERRNLRVDVRVKPTSKPTEPTRSCIYSGQKPTREPTETYAPGSGETYVSLSSLRRGKRRNPGTMIT
jgi:hypothetical protein